MTMTSRVGRNGTVSRDVRDIEKWTCTTRLLFLFGGCIRVGSGNGMSSPFIRLGDGLAVTSAFCLRSESRCETLPCLDQVKPEIHDRKCVRVGVILGRAGTLVSRALLLIQVWSLQWDRPIQLFQTRPPCSTHSEAGRSSLILRSIGIQLRVVNRPPNCQRVGPSFEGHCLISDGASITSYDQEMRRFPGSMGARTSTMQASGIHNNVGCGFTCRAMGGEGPNSTHRVTAGWPTWSL